jgi:C1A family cysteine protease
MKQLNKINIDLNLQPSPKDARDFLASVNYSDKEFLPAHVDLLPDVEEVENQYQTGSCTANAAATALEITYKRAGKSKDFSRLYNYWYSRAIGNISGDKGAYPRDVCKALNKHGICLESTWEFDIEKNLNVEPSIDAQEEAKQYPVHEYARLDDDRDIVVEIKKAVAAGIPVMTSIKVSKGFNSLGLNWKEHDWDPEQEPIGAHQVVIIGYDDKAQRFLAQNSWGNRWADGGFFGIPYTRIGTDYYVKSTSSYEYWILTKLDVPYVDADGTETDPYNIIEIERSKSEQTKNLLFAVIFGSIFAFIMMMLTR